MTDAISSATRARSGRSNRTPQRRRLISAVALLLLITPGFASAQAGGSGYALHLPAMLAEYRACTAVPVLLTPPDGVVLDGLFPDFTWSISEPVRVTEFHFQLAQDPAFTTLVHQAHSVGPALWFRPGTTWSEILIDYLAPTATTYYWRAAVSCLAEGQTEAEPGPYSAAHTFVTVIPDPLPIPPAPSLLSPPDASVSEDVTVTLHWTPVPEAHFYKVILQAAGDSGVITCFVTEPTKTYTLSRNTTYEWSVVTIGAYVPSPATATWRFTTPP